MFVVVTVPAHGRRGDDELAPPPLYRFLPPDPARITRRNVTNTATAAAESDPAGPPVDGT